MNVCRSFNMQSSRHSGLRSFIVGFLFPLLLYGDILCWQQVGVTCKHHFLGVFQPHLNHVKCEPSRRWSCIDRCDGYDWVEFLFRNFNFDSRSAQSWGLLGMNNIPYQVLSSALLGILSDIMDTTEIMLWTLMLYPLISMERRTLHLLRADKMFCRRLSQSVMYLGRYAMRASALSDQPSTYGDLKPDLRVLSGCASWTAL